ncbi:uncharacterized protein LOC110410816 [Herrania umbratica]|uniref:Uncharacterized protein LOC110410816 n=1 Tax=Herrania umbratica TaxID=108875 RepID=A0A6J0ZNH7_9ROSI|nr:uncharacterized protein LOC110410816 [Herrania umbratica]
MENFGGKKRSAINLKLFTTLSESFSSPNPTKSPRNFQDGVVGLGIVAAMTDSSNTHEAICFARSPRSTPIPIVSSAKAAANFRGGRNSESLDELSENYTCVISHFGDNLIKKHVYFGDEEKNSSVFTASSSSANKSDVGQVKREIWSDDFLSSCHLCKRELHGLDIFMYRGERAYCSAECRDKQITSDDHKEICGREARKQLDCSVSPCSGPEVFFAGVAAA